LKVSAAAAAGEKNKNLGQAGHDTRHQQLADDLDDAMLVVCLDGGSGFKQCNSSKVGKHHITLDDMPYYTQAIVGQAS
jgi:hypothetical protein